MRIAIFDDLELLIYHYQYGGSSCTYYSEKNTSLLVSCQDQISRKLWQHKHGTSTQSQLAV